LNYFLALKRLGNTNYFMWSLGRLVYNNSYLLGIPSRFLPVRGSA
jgi:hypothetical protein